MPVGASCRPRHPAGHHLVALSSRGSAMWWLGWVHLSPSPQTLTSQEEIWLGPSQEVSLAWDEQTPRGHFCPHLIPRVGLGRERLQ